MTRLFPEPPPRRSLALWALLAIVLVALSYVFTLLLAAACVYLPFALLSVSSTFYTLVLFLSGCVVGAVILWSLVPRKDKFVPPGPRLDASEHPRLFAELTDIAGSLREPMPVDVYLVPEVNAWVAERGGVLGSGSRRVMGLGLPLIRILTIGQLRAVLAHEFAHYYSGDTRLWPWVHRTRAAMIRTLTNLGSDSLARALGRFWLSQLMHRLAVAALVAYWKLFMRITQAISRRHEYRADELAGHVAGPQPLIDGLTAIHAAAVAFAPFWQSEVVPALSVGCRPPIADGFARFIAVPNIARELAAHLESEMAGSATDPYDTHPPLKDRIAALLGGVQQAPAGAGAETPAVELFDSLDRLELSLLEMLLPDGNVSGLKPLSWECIGPEAYLPAWKKIAVEAGSLLGDYRIENLAEAVANLPHLASGLRDPQGMLLTREQRVERAAQALWMGFTTALCDRGWHLRATPGELFVERDEFQFAPTAIVAKMRSGGMTDAEWRAQCGAAGIAGLPLAPAGE